MTIYILERESTAWTVINILHGIHDGVNSLTLWLRDNTRSISTIDIIEARNNWANVYTQLNNFNTSYGVWFATAWSDYADALTGAITSFQNINNVITQGLRDWYWDEDTDKPIISEISWEHRNQLASYIEEELE